MREFCLTVGATPRHSCVMEKIPILFNQAPDDLRRIGARGGRAYGRNCRARRQAMAQSAPVAVLPVLPPAETTAQATAKLDAKFPWLRGADVR